MRSYKYIAAFIVLLLLDTGFAHAQKYFKVIDARSTAWAGGMAQNGTGTTYDIGIVLLTKQKITFNDMWVGREHGMTETRSASYSDGRALTKGDTAIVTYTIHHYPPGSPRYRKDENAETAPPREYKGDALLLFTVGKHHKDEVIEKFAEQPAKKYM